MNFSIGCAVWAYKGWVGEFYPPESRPSEFLQLGGFGREFVGLYRKIMAKPAPTNRVFHARQKLL